LSEDADWYGLTSSCTFELKGSTSLTQMSPVGHTLILPVRQHVVQWKFTDTVEKHFGLENRDYGRRGSAALTMRHPSKTKLKLKKLNSMV
jgi:hypothetical protein